MTRYIKVGRAMNSSDTHILYPHDIEDNDYKYFTGRIGWFTENYEISKSYR